MKMVRIKYWIQRHGESGHWALTGLMKESAALRRLTYGWYDQGEIVEDSEFEEEGEQ